METAMRLNDPKSHAVVECIPVPPKVTAHAACEALPPSTAALAHKPSILPREAPDGAHCHAAVRPCRLLPDMQSEAAIHTALVQGHDHVDALLPQRVGSWVQGMWGMVEAVSGMPPGLVHAGNGRGGHVSNKGLRLLRGKQPQGVTDPAIARAFARWRPRRRCTSRRRWTMRRASGASTTPSAGSTPPQRRAASPLPCRATPSSP